jgi:ribose 5-phosphate isomerase B
VKVIVGSVVKGFALKEAVTARLRSLGHEVIDVGCHDTSAFVKFPSIGQRVAKALQDGVAPLAINCCGSGTGASISAGKYRGVCAVSCESVKTARMIRVVNDANCLCMGEGVVTPDLACDMAEAFVSARFQDMDGIPPDVLAFWEEARDELMNKGEADASAREIETLP